jgi:hypothetical protein
MSQTMNIDEQVELAQMLARFKLHVRRVLNESVDLDLLKNDPEYARERLSQIEEKAEDEDLLVSVLMLRERLCSRAPARSASPEPQPHAPETKYRFGARG